MECPRETQPEPSWLGSVTPEKSVLRPHSLINRIVRLESAAPPSFHLTSGQRCQKPELSSSRSMLGYNRLSWPDDRSDRWIGQPQPLQQLFVAALAVYAACF